MLTNDFWEVPIQVPPILLEWKETLEILENYFLEAFRSPTSAGSAGDQWKENPDPRRIRDLPLVRNYRRGCLETLGITGCTEAIPYIKGTVDYSGSIHLGRLRSSLDKVYALLGEIQKLIDEHQPPEDCFPESFKGLCPRIEAEGVYVFSYHMCENACWARTSFGCYLWRDHSWVRAIPSEVLC